MIIHKLKLDDFEDSDFSLVAIHTSLLSHELAYLINKHFPVLLQLTDPILSFYAKQDCFFGRYTWQNNQFGEIWDLFENKTEATANSRNQEGFFFSEMKQIIHLLPEFKKADFFLKIQNSSHPIEHVVKLLKKIKKLSAVYHQETMSEKSKFNLIF